MPGRFRALDHLVPARPARCSPAIQEDARGEARRGADRVREQTGVELTAEEILDSPHVFIGSIMDLTRPNRIFMGRFIWRGALSWFPVISGRWGQRCWGGR